MAIFTHSITTRRRVHRPDGSYDYIKVTCNVHLTIDIDQLALDMGFRAIENKHRKSQLFNGTIKATLSGVEDIEEDVPN
jgi:hypothetical protein